MNANTWLLQNLTGGAGTASLVASWLLIATALLALAMFFKPALGLSQSIDRINTWIGSNVAWLILLAVLVSTVNAIIRKVFNQSSNAWLEIQWILFGAVFLLCAPWTLMLNEHIRIDIVNSLLAKKTRHWIDVIGHWFFILPICLVMLYTGIPFFWRLPGHGQGQEGSAVWAKDHIRKLFICTDWVAKRVHDDRDCVGCLFCRMRCRCGEDSE